ncbi:HNH endonuclease family protein [Pectobacterium punjabense]|uniref:hypothetical protein n=1 Tax=Pectobacterium punjabense TaxID=2108399 RepID=UPI00196955D2|nr:hypothetical protein [Pectobacterium punjabense]MBN3137966.1 hypothetical protein [Pectobacterium punjabense]MCE5382025.1 hypothetical protein [Pectobacterium punjabense]
MIKINRPDDSEPNELRSAAARELRRNRIKKRNDENLTFSEYSKKYVKDALNNIFKLKCAFCDSRLNGAGDIEHYRPKGKVYIKNGTVVEEKDGYYWLAASWKNLLISCVDCNQRRSQLEEDGITWRVTGKGCFFPLVNEDMRAAGPIGVSAEQPLLINPCVTDPEQHIRLLENGSIESMQIHGNPSPQGVATIEICGLKRLELLKSRAERAKIIKSAIRHIVRDLEEGRDPTEDLDDLIILLDSSAPYLALARRLTRELLGPYISSLQLDQLLTTGVSVPGVVANHEIIEN